MLFSCISLIQNTVYLVTICLNKSNEALLALRSTLKIIGPRPQLEPRVIYTHTVTKAKEHGCILINYWISTLLQGNSTRSQQVFFMLNQYSKNISVAGVFIRNCLT